MKNGRRFLFVWSLFFLISFAAAQTPGADPGGGLWTRRSDGTVLKFPLTHTEVRAAISGPVASVEVEQIFGNPSEEPIEALYTFPLPDMAAVFDLEIVVGNRVIRGDIAERKEAEERYAQALEEGYTAALLDQERPNVFSQKVGHIAPRMQIAVRLRYLERLKEKAGRFTFLFPTVVLYRYGGGGASADNPAAGEDHGASSKGPEVAISVDLESPLPLTELRSLSHRMEIQREGPRRARVTLAPDDRLPNKDFILEFGGAEEETEGGVLTHGQDGEGYFLLRFQLGPQADPPVPEPKEIIFVLDASGSMENLPIQMAKKLILGLLLRFGAQDTFNIVSFSESVEVFNAASSAVSTSSVAAAEEWLNQFNGEGGTEFLLGLEGGFSLPADSGRRRLMIFLTDGGYKNDDEVLRQVKEKAQGTQIFTVGVSSSANHYLLDRMASLSGGDYLVVRPDADRAVAIGQLMTGIRGMWLTDLTIDWGRLRVTDLFPDSLPPLASDQPLTLIGRYLWPGKETLILHGLKNGVPWEKQVDVEFPEAHPGNAVLAPLWARHRIDGLLMESLEEDRPEVKAEVLALALQFRLMSPFTSFVAVDEVPSVDPGTPRKKVTQPLPPAQFVPLAAVFGEEGPEVWSRNIERSEFDPGKMGACRVKVQDPNGNPLEGAKVFFSPFYTSETPLVQDSDSAGIVFFGAVVPDKNRHLAVIKRGYTNNWVWAAIETGKTTEIVMKMVPELAEEVKVADLKAGSHSGSIPGPLDVAPGVPGGVSGGVIGGVLGGVVGGVAAPPPPLPPLPGSALEVGGTLPGPPRGFAGLLDQGAAGGMEPDPSGQKVLGKKDLSAADAKVVYQALRVLADVAERGRLSLASGRPALAALLGLQFESGAFSRDIRIHALATWAIVEAAETVKDFPREKEWLTQAARRSIAHLAKVRLDQYRWPLLPGGAGDAAASGYARLALRAASRAGLWSENSDQKFPDPPAGPGPAEKYFASLLQCLKRSSAAEKKGGGFLGPADRLLASAGKGHLAAGGKK